MPVENFENAAQESVRHQHARRNNVDQRDIALAGDGADRTRPTAADSETISVPSTSGLREFRIRTGMFFSMAGSTVAGCSTFAPK